MNVRSRAASIVLSWDLALAAACAAACRLALPANVDIGFAKDLYAVAISVLSIVFSVFFAALAIVMSASDDEFVAFLEETGDYSNIVSTFVISLALLFIGLLVSIGFYGYTSFWTAAQQKTQTVWLLAGCAFVFFYGLFAAALASKDAIAYSTRRARFVKAKGRCR